MSVTNTAEIRSQNKKKIIEYLRFEPSTKKIMSDRLELSFSTVSNLSNQLIEEGILEIVSSRSSNGGRIPGLISIRPDGKYTLCLDFNNLGDAKVALVNLNNDLIGSAKVNVHEETDYDELIQTYYEESVELLATHGISTERLLGVGAAIPGIFYKRNNSVINSTNRLFENKLLKNDLEQKFGLPVWLENESNLLVLASLIKERGGAKEKDIIYIYLGDGLGVGIIHKGSLLTGSRGLGGEVSHIPLGFRQFPCYCGKSGCTESELTLAGFYRKLHGKDIALPENLNGWWKQFIQEVESGNKQAREIVAENGKLLGTLISVLANIFDPDEVYIGGFTEAIFPILYPHIVEETKERMQTKQFFVPQILNSTGYGDLITAGCGELVFKRWDP
jgi:predicted NBD/HSP70 family sugar kinase